MKRKKLTLRERKKQYKTVIKYFRMKEEFHRKKEANYLNDYLQAMDYETGGYRD